MYAILQKLTAITDSHQKAILIPSVIIKVLCYHNLLNALYKITAIINTKRTVSITTAQGYCSSYYAEYYLEMSKAVYNFLNLANQSYLAICLVPLKSQVMINYILNSSLPSDLGELHSEIASRILISSDI
jgi:hypothetical protein